MSGKHSRSKGRTAISRGTRLVGSFWIPVQLPGLNEILALRGSVYGSGHRRQDGYNARKQQISRSIALEAAAQRLPRFTKPVELDFVWVEPNRRRDKDNVAAGGRKLILDALVEAGFLIGDGWAHIARFSDRFEINAAAPGVRVKVSEIIATTNQETKGVEACQTTD